MRLATIINIGRSGFKQLLHVSVHRDDACPMLRRATTPVHERKDERADGQSSAGDTCLYLVVIDVEVGSETGWMDWNSRISGDNGET